VTTMTDLDPAVYHRRLLVAFRDLRSAAKLTQEQVAALLGWSPSKVLRIENGKNNISRDDLTALLAVYGVTGGQQVLELVELAGRASRPSFPQFKDAVSAEFRVYAGLESAASSIWEYEPLLIPGLLQTPEYMRSVITALSLEGDEEELITRRMRIREERQRMHDRPNPPRMRFLLDEAAVRRQVGGRGVMADQLRFLKELNAQPHISIQIVPFSVGEHTSMTGPFIVLEFDDGDSPLLYLEDSRHDMLTRDDLELTRTYQRRFDEIAALATPAARFDRVVDDLIASLDLGLALLAR
jgi:transcriptional regulator with XRE-family HTH domain